MCCRPQHDRQSHPPRDEPTVNFMRAKQIVLTAVVTLLGQRSLPAQRPAAPQYRQQPPFNLKGAFGTTGDWKAVVTAAINPAREIVSDEGASQSRICFIRAAPAASRCAYFRDLFHSKLAFQVMSSLSVRPLRSGSSPVSGLVMKADAFYSTGQIHETAIWVYDPQQDRFHLTAAVDSGEVRVFTSGPLNGFLVTADWHRDQGDTRWSDHRRDITVYRYSGNGGEAQFGKVLSYTTTKRYSAEDTGSIDTEQANIEAQVTSLHR